MSLTNNTKDLLQQALQGSTDAMNVLGAFYLSAEDMEQYKQAFYWFRESAKRGDEDAAEALSYMYYHWIGTATNRDKSFKWHVLWEKV